MEEKEDALEKLSVKLENEKYRRKDLYEQHTTLRKEFREFRSDFRRNEISKLSHQEEFNDFIVYCFSLGIWLLLTIGVSINLADLVGYEIVGWLFAALSAKGVLAYMNQRTKQLRQERELQKLISHEELER